MAMAFSKRDLEVQCSCWQRCGGAGAQPAAAAVIVAAVYVVPRAERKEGRYRKGGAFTLIPALCYILLSRLYVAALRPGHASCRRRQAPAAPPRGANP